MTEQQCTSVAELVVDGRIVVGYLQCTEPAGHDASTTGLPWSLGVTELGTPHRAELTWGDGDEVTVSVKLPAAVDLEPGTRDDIEPDPLCGERQRIKHGGAYLDVTCRNLAGHVGAHHDERERATWPRDDRIEPNPADVLSIASAVPVPGLCNVEGCVFVAEHERAGSPLHSWARAIV